MFAHPGPRLVLYCLGRAPALTHGRDRWLAHAAARPPRSPTCCAPRAAGGSALTQHLVRDVSEAGMDRMDGWLVDGHLARCGSRYGSEDHAWSPEPTHRDPKRVARASAKHCRARRLARIACNAVGLGPTHTHDSPPSVRPASHNRTATRHIHAARRGYRVLMRRASPAAPPRPHARAVEGALGFVMSRPGTLVGTSPSAHALGSASSIALSEPQLPSSRRWGCARCPAERTHVTKLRMATLRAAIARIWSHFVTWRTPDHLRLPRG